MKSGNGELKRQLFLFWVDKGRLDKVDFLKSMQEKCQDGLANILPISWKDSPTQSQITGNHCRPHYGNCIALHVFPVREKMVFTLAVLLCN